MNNSSFNSFCAMANGFEKTEGITELSLFAGMSCGQIALKELDIKVKTHYASEIDKFAIGETQLNFPDTIQLGNIVKLKRAMMWKDSVFNKLQNSSYISSETKKHFTFMRNIDWGGIDLILAGSPCQGFSFAGKQLNFNDPRSKLFFVFADILNHCKKLNPDVKFLLENVNMKKEYQKVINDILGLFPVRINSNRVSAQNRDRLYWTNIRTKKVGLFGEIHSDIPQPKDRGILLKDILQPESEVDEKYYISDAVINRMNRKQYSKPKINPQKTGSLNTKNNSGQSSLDSGTTFVGLDINKKAPTQRNSTGRCLDKKHNYQIIKLDKQLNKKADQLKAGCLTGGGHSGGNHSDMDILCVSMVGRKLDENGTRKDYDKTIKAKQQLELAPENKTNCLTSVQKDNLLLVQNNRIKNNLKGDNEKANCFLSTSWKGAQANGMTLTEHDYKLRRLTPLECARLQTVPDWYKWNCSDTQQYKMLGNGNTIKVFTHILSFLLPIGQSAEEKLLKRQKPTRLK